MNAWFTSGSNTVSKAEAVTAIIKLAEDCSIRGSFKTYYDGSLIADSDDLPNQVDMSKIRVSAIADQA